MIDPEKTRLLGNQSEPSIKPFDSIEKGNHTPEETTTNTESPSYYTNALIIRLLLFVILFCIPFLIIYGFQKEQKNIFIPNLLTSQELPDQSKIYLSSAYYNHSFIRTNPENSDYLIVEDVPWIHSSTLIVHRIDEECFQLSTLQKKWLYLEYYSGNLRSDGILHSEASYFSAVKIVFPLNETNEAYQYPNDRIHSHSYPIMLKLCQKDLYFELSSLIYEQQQVEDFKVSTSVTYNANIKLINSSKKYLNEQSSWFPFYTHHIPHKNTSDILDEIAMTHTSPMVFHAHIHEQIYGVNLGGWFIPEVWMNPSFYNNTGLGWTGSICRMVNYSATLTETRMKEQLSTWITEKDIQEIASMGFNSIRLPVGYWNIIKDPYKIYSPADITVSDYYIHWLFNMTLQYNLTVLLDLHGGPGSQNGIDHSGCSRPPKWYLKENINLSLKTIDTMMLKYGHYSNLLGIELMNEPAHEYSTYQHSFFVTNFYTKAYHIIRDKYPHFTGFIVINELYEESFRRWKHDLSEQQGYYNIIFDWHLYNWQEPYTHQTAKQHLENAKNWEKTINYYQEFYPVLIGEWCMSTGTVLQVGQSFVNQCTRSFQSSFGWYLWNWKIEHGVHFDEWNVQYQHELMLQNNSIALNPFEIL